MFLSGLTIDVWNASDRIEPNIISLLIVMIANIISRDKGLGLLPLPTKTHARYQQRHVRSSHHFAFAPSSHTCHGFWLRSVAFVQSLMSAVQQCRHTTRCLIAVLHPATSSIYRHLPVASGTGTKLYYCDADTGQCLCKHATHRKPRCGHAFTSFVGFRHSPRLLHGGMVANGQHYFCRSFLTSSSMLPCQAFKKSLE